MFKAKVILVIFFSVFSGVVLAGASEGFVGTPLVNEQGVFMFSAGAKQGVTCATLKDQWALDAKTSAGKAMQALVLSAYAQGKRLHVEGRGPSACDVWGDRETPSYLFIVD